MVDRRRLGALFRRRADAGEGPRRRCRRRSSPTSSIGILTFTTYTLAGHMREQVCLYMCPWPRIQAALTDEYALNVTYRYDRGEPRSVGEEGQRHCARKASRPATASTASSACTSARPASISAMGRRLGCIQCGLCIDACDKVMAKIGRPPGLIAYDTDINIKRRMDGKAPIFKLVRPRTVLYAAIIAVVGGDDAVHAGDARERTASASSTTAIRCSCACPTARCATPTPSASSTSSSSGAISSLSVQRPAGESDRFRRRAAARRRRSC